MAKPPLGVCVIRGKSNRWLTRDYGEWFPHLPERTRLFCLFNSHRTWTKRFLADPTLLGLLDSYGLELIHPRREGRNPHPIGKKGVLNKRWIVGGKLCFVLNHLGLFVDWEVDTANVYDGTAFQALVERNMDEMALFADTGFVKKGWHPANLKICQPGELNSRMIQETVLAL